MKTFKVRVTRAGDGDHWYSEKIGEVFSVRGRDRDMYLLTKGHKGIMKSDCVIVEDTMEYTKNGVTYRQLRNITVKALILAGADDNYVEHFDLSHDITEPILIKYAIDYALHSSYDFQKLVDQGFVEVVEEALKPCPFCGGEAIWVTEDKNWIMCKECTTDGRLRKSHQDAIDAWNKRV